MRSASWSPALAWVGMLFAAAIMGLIAARFELAAIVVVGLMLIGSILLSRWGGEGNALRLGWIPAAWVAMMFVSDHHFLDPFRSPLEAASGKPSLENLVQLCVYAVVGAMVLRCRRAMLQEAPSWISKGPLLAFPAFAIASVVWSPVKLFSFIRASQLLVFVALALLCVRIWRSSDELGESIWRSSLRALVQVTTILSILGLVLSEEVSGRKTWPGAGPGGAATWVGASLLILVVGGRSFVPTPKWSYWPRIVLFVWLLNLTLTRSVILGLAVAGLAVLWDKGRDTPIARYLGIWYYASAVVATLALAEAPVFAYLSRGDTDASLLSLSGRVPLWQTAINDLVHAGKVVEGYGYGAARVVLFPQVSWAGTAHSSWVEALVDVGIIGVVLLAAPTLYFLWRLAAVDRSTTTSRVCLGLLVFLLVASFASELLALPGIGFGLLSLLTIPTLSSRGRSVDELRTWSLPSSARLPRGARADTMTHGYR